MTCGTIKRQRTNNDYNKEKECLDSSEMEGNAENSQTSSTDGRDKTNFPKSEA